MIDLVKKMLVGQYEGGLAMLEDCVRKCPDEHWDMPIAKYPFWHVVYHTLCYVDLYCAKSNKSWRPDQVLHPKGRTELREEYPSRRFTREELLGYIELCREKSRASVASETARSLAGPSGFSWMKFSRGEAHVYNIRHLQHHVGQLGALLRRVDGKPVWVMGSKVPPRVPKAKKPPPRRKAPAVKHRA